jgi:SnoaL-like domain
VGYHFEVLATLGERLVLVRHQLSAGELRDDTWDFGKCELPQLVLSEVDPRGRSRHVEFFAGDHLGDAIVGLYDRYAETLPEGSGNARAAATARTVAALPIFGVPDVDRYFAALAPDLDFADHRTAAIGAAHGTEAFQAWVGSLFEVADDIVTRAEDVLALRPDALLVRWINSGTQRAGGGTFERHLLMLWVFGADGRVARLEQWDLEAADEALARCDELAREALPALPRPISETERKAPLSPPLAGKGARASCLMRRVRPNALTAAAARLDAAMAARDAGALRAIAAEEPDVVTVDNPNGCTYDAAATLATRLAMLKAEDLEFRQEPLATLGDSLACSACRCRRAALRADGSTSAPTRAS